MADEKQTRPRTLGNYQLLDLLGEGGMGEVWRARHRTLARPAAVKTIKAERLGASTDNQRDVILRRFEREAKATAALTSPHTIDLYDFGSQDGTFYYAMELLHGLDLASLVQRFGPIEAHRTVHILMQVCDSLAEAHKQGLVHRDIKPANIYVCRQGLKFDFVKVLDFGLVKPRPAKGRDISQLTTDAVAPGTPAFMPPETALAAEIDHRADLYALGCVAFWLLTGKLVFERETPIKMVLAHVQEAAPSVKSHTELNVPDALDALISSLLAKKPEDRPENALAVRRSLRKLSIEPWTEDAAESWWHSHIPELADSDSEDAERFRSALAELDDGPPETQPEHNTLVESAGAKLAETTGTEADSADNVAETPRPKLTPHAAERLSQSRADVVRQLRHHFAHSTLDIHEFERRTEQAESADDHDALKLLVVDLPMIGSDGVELKVPTQGALVQAKADQPPDAGPAQGDLVRSRRRTQTVVAILGGSSRRGRWKPARTIKAFAMMGGVDLDFREAKLPPGTTEIQVFCLMGGVDIIVPPGVEVENRGVGIMGGFDSRVDFESTDPEAPRLVVKGFAIMGGCDIRTRQRKIDTRLIPLERSSAIEAEQGALVPAQEDADDG